ncbi:MAG: lipopolysaccharide biosynthesis protein [Clostridium sp.]|uniref:lipopolysaccharide biosynthesis protein n=1 Tax=Clostridium sp. TaxID=1506 RepID=UPI003F30D116
MSREGRMLKTTIIYFIGNFSSKLLAFFLLPIYTAYLTVEDFGAVDIVTSTLPLIAPIFTMQVTESVFRFLCGDEYKNDKKKIITNSFIIFITGIGIFIALYLPIISKFDFEYKTLFLIYFITVYLGMFFQQVLRGFQKNLDYAIMGIISTVVQATVNITLIVKFNFGGESLLIASICASSMIAVIGAIKTKIWRLINFKYYDLEIIKKQLRYGIPLIPNQICWWIIGVLGKYILLYFSGTADNGILAVSSKFPSLLTTISSIFFLAWTENIIKEFKAVDRDEYFSNSFNTFFIFSLTVATCLLPIIKIYNVSMVKAEFIEAWLYIPVLFIGALFNGFSSFLGTAYTASMQTRDAFTTTIIGAVSNLIFSIILTPTLGIWGVVLANMLSFLVLFIARLKSINKIIDLKVQIKNKLGAMVVLIIGIFSYYLIDVRYQLICLIVFGISMIILNKELIVSFNTIIKKRVARN